MGKQRLAEEILEGGFGVGMVETGDLLEPRGGW
jgi:hypothetical protein